ncbi:hypothetical protein ACX0G9_01555 [Flavitalea flava]
MPINQNHLFDELDGIKCAIVEKNALPERVDFLRPLLTWNGYTVVVVPSPPPKSAPAPAAVPPSPIPESYTLGVTDLTFNPTNAIFGRLLRTQEGHIVTLAYWKQQEKKSHDEVPYFEA